MIKWEYFVGFMHINVTRAEVIPWESSPLRASADCTLINGQSSPVNRHRFSTVVRIRVQEPLEPIATRNNSVLPDRFIVHALSPASVAVIYAVPWTFFGFHEDLGVCCLVGRLVRPLERRSQVFSLCAYVRLPTSVFLRESAESQLCRNFLMCAFFIHCNAPSTSRNQGLECWQLLKRLVFNLSIPHMWTIKSGLHFSVVEQVSCYLVRRIISCVFVMY